MIQFFDYSRPLTTATFINRTGSSYKDARRALEYLVAAGYILPRAQGFVLSPHVRRSRDANIR